MKTRYHKIKFYVSSTIVVCFALLLSCANPGFPTGGPKDYDAPVVVKSNPKANSLNFDGKIITVEFNEIIKLDNVQQKFVSSPPLKETPDIQARANKLRIRLGDDEELQENTTYTLDLGDAIQDNNEGNPISSFVLSFATGNEIDSFSVMGNVYDAYDLTPIKNVMVMAHKTLEDTAFTNVVPERIAKTNSDGFFAIRNLPQSEFKIYALNDVDRNYIYNQPSEQIAWLDSSVYTRQEYVNMPDSIFTDSIAENGDVFSVLDTIEFKEVLAYTPFDLRLFLYQEDSYNQYMVSYDRPKRNTISFKFNEEIDSFKITPLNTDFDSNWMVKERNEENDSLLIWVRDSSIFDTDTLDLAIEFMALDSLEQPTLTHDTLRLYNFKKEVKESRRDKKLREEKEAVEGIKIETIMPENTQREVDVYSNFNFTMPEPILDIDKSKLKLYQKVDTLWNDIDYKLIQDSILARKYWVVSKWTPGASYNFVIDSLGITNIYNLHTDSINNNFNVKELKSYGLILIDFEEHESDWLIQLQKNNGEIIQQKYIPANGKLAFQYINSGTYNLKLVVDKNMNEKWDSGDYKSKTLPEEVRFYESSVEVKSNWDIEITWNPNDFNFTKFVKNNRKAKDISAQ